MQGNVTNFKVPFSSFQSTSQPHKTLDRKLTLGKFQILGIGNHLRTITWRRSSSSSWSETPKRNAAWGRKRGGRGEEEGEERKETFTCIKKELISLITLSPSISFLPKVKAPRTQLRLPALVTFLSETGVNYQYLSQGTSLDLGWDSLG